MLYNSKNRTWIILGIASLLCSRIVFSFINDPEGPNLLVVFALALVFFCIFLALYLNKNLFKLLGAIIFCELAGVIGSFFTIPSISSWYSILTKPNLAPPNWIFGPVWTTLYALMGIAAYLVWQKGLERKEVKVALGIFFLQLALNVLWSIIFFGHHSPAGAFAEITLLWLAILATILIFRKISKGAAWLLVPYLLWVTFAGYLNLLIWRLN